MIKKTRRDSEVNEEKELVNVKTANGGGDDNSMRSKYRMPTPVTLAGKIPDNNNEVHVWIGEGGKSEG